VLQVQFLQQQLKAWKLEAAKHTTPSTFVHKAKAERKVVVLEKQLEQMNTQQVPS
jgi:hypothetical protein